MHKEFTKRLSRFFFLFLFGAVSILILSCNALAVDINPRVAIVYSNTSYLARNLTSETEGVHYLYEVSSTEHQFMMAGIPFEMIGENDLTNQTLINQYTVIVLPSFSNVRASIKDQILSNLENAVKNNGLNVYAFGDLMVANESNVKYTYAAGQAPVNRILNVQYVTGPVDADVILTAMNSSNPVTWRYKNNESLFKPDWYGYTQYQVYNASEPFSYPFQAYDITAKNFFPETVATKNHKGRIFYSANPSQTVQSAIGRDAILWLIYEDKPHFGIKMTNRTAFFSVRVDGDDSGTTATGIAAIPNFLDLMGKNNLLGGWYITTNNGGNSPVDWNTLKPYYQKLMNKSFEIGSHSVTHPDDMNLQTDSVLYNEFNNSKKEINTQLGINITGFVNPGNTPLQLRLWRIANQTGYKYYSPLQDENYKGFGYVTNDLSVVNLESNMISDYELMTLQSTTDNQTADYWKNEFNLYYRWGDGIFTFVLWHDYLLNTRYNAYYTFAKYVNSTDTEGVTPNDAVQRFIDWNSQDFVVSSFTVNGSDAWSLTRISTKTKYGQITFAPSSGLRGFTGTSQIKKTPDNRSYTFSFETDTVTFYFNTTSSATSLILNSIGNKTVSENSTLTFNLTVLYNGSGTITYSKDSSYGMLNSTSGRFTWTPAFGTHGIYTINFTATDGTVSDKKTTLITVLKTNRAPVLQPLNNIIVLEGALIQIIPNATDPDGDLVTYSYTTPCNASGGWQTQIGNAGVYVVNVTASDGNLSTSQSVLINVTSALVTVNLTFTTGWNLISIPIIPVDNHISTIMNGCNYTRVWAFQTDQSWISTDTGLSTMDDRHGYWVDRLGMPNNCTISIQGTNPGTTQLNATPSWTLVGFPSQTPQPISSVISPSLYDKIWEYQTDQTWISTETSLVNFTVGKGYWIDGTIGGMYTVTYS